jgi:predicted GIY-YIG superfamily endonuclease
MSQLLLFPDDRPLVARLGRQFFRELPDCAGVYLMRDAADTVLYVGKAKNLRKRLGSYRVANPDRMPRRHLRLLRAVVRIEVQTCGDESSALARESELLRSIKPRFNRAGTWPAPIRFLGWRCVSNSLELEVLESPEEGWSVHGPMGGGAVRLRAVLARLLWVGLNPQCGLAGMPAGWVRGRFSGKVLIHCGAEIEESSGFLGKMFVSEMAGFGEWLRSRIAQLHRFELMLVEKDLEYMTDIFNPTHKG